ncbi:hypothetical protein GOODEAATRI_007596 [Goodea atripinnis]|uniref:Choline/carnitine acyltransferase domain-containing protein n=1 Tax=Goodea atripinnis TaxID=208336 RepID=A0ABV0MGX3_9TELE
MTAEGLPICIPGTVEGFSASFYHHAGGYCQSCGECLIPERSFAHQEGLPKLPVPPLKQTCDRYLATLEAIVSDEELEHTRMLLQEFLKSGVGERLQKELERRARKTDNWDSNLDLLLYYTRYIHVEQTIQICYIMLSDFGCACSCQSGGCNVYNSDGTPLTVDQITMQLEKIWNSSLQTNKEPIGILTSQHRNTWGKAYNNLIKALFIPDVLIFVNRQRTEMVRSPMVPLAMPQKLRFNITPEIKRDIEKAKQNMNMCVGSKTDCVMCFGPMVPDGYGVCYNPMDEHINIAITAFNSCEDTNAANFAEAVKKALLDMRALLTETAATRQ